MKNFYYSIVPVPLDAVGSILEACDEQGYTYVDSLPIGAAPARVIAAANQQYIPCFMLLVCKEFPDRESASPPEPVWQKHNPPMGG
jgi:hypothetical protein